MKYFAGLDVSLEETAICVVDDSGRIVKETRAVSEPQALSDALRKAGEVTIPQRYPQNNKKQRVAMFINELESLLTN